MSGSPAPEPSQTDRASRNPRLATSCEDAAKAECNRTRTVAGPYSDHGNPHGQLPFENMSLQQRGGDIALELDPPVAAARILARLDEAHAPFPFDSKGKTSRLGAGTRGLEPKTVPSLRRRW